MEKRFLVFGAHPDDPDLMFGGTAVLLTRAGHKVKFVSVTNGNAGHHQMPQEELAKRRRGRVAPAGMLRHLHFVSVPGLPRRSQAEAGGSRGRKPDSRQSPKPTFGRSGTMPPLTRRLTIKNRLRSIKSVIV